METFYEKLRLRDGLVWTLLPTVEQPRSQGFSLEDGAPPIFKGKALGTRLTVELKLRFETVFRRDLERALVLSDVILPFLHLFFVDRILFKFKNGLTIINNY